VGNTRFARARDRLGAFTSTAQRLRTPQGGEIEVRMDILTITLRLKIRRTGGGHGFRDLCGRVSFRPRSETIPVCHALVQDPKFFALLLRIDHELAAQARADGCRCGVALHRADYPQAAGLPGRGSRRTFFAPELFSVLSAASVRHRGRCDSLAGVCICRLGTQLGVTRRTMARWQAWWLERFTAVAHEALMHESVMRLLVWLSPVTVRDGGPSSIELHEGC